MANFTFKNSMGYTGAVNTSSVGLSQSGGTNEGANEKTNAKPSGPTGIPPQNPATNKVAVPNRNAK